MLITSPEGIFRLIAGGTMLGALAKAIKCGCGRMVMFVVNRDGQTRCVECDHLHQNARKPAESDHKVHQNARYGSGWKTKSRSGA